MGPSDKLRKLGDAAFQKATFTYAPNVCSHRTDGQDTQASDIAIQIEIEEAHWINLFKDSTTAKQHLDRALELSGMTVLLTGALGRRTKFQSFDLPQLVLLAESKETEAQSMGAVPQTILNDDVNAVALESGIRFKTDLPASNANLNIIDQAILLALCLNVKNNNPKCGLTYEEMLVYVERVLKNPNNWMVHSMALLLRSRLESMKQKTIDRACLQLEVLVNQMNSDLEKEYDASIRMKYLHLLAFPPNFKLKKELGKRWLQIGSVDSALQLFEPLEMWEEVIECYQVKGDDKKALEIINERIAIHPTPHLYCLLGDLTKDPSYYTKAWDLSKGRFTAAKRLLGKYHMDREEWKIAIEHFAAAVAINPQFGSAWFRMGCCALRVMDLTVAQKSFARVVQLHPDEADAWNNLAAVYIHQNKKKEAFKALKQSIRFNGTNWKVYENFIFVALEIGEFSECIQAMKELLHLKESQQVDIQALSLLIKYVMKDLVEGKSQEGMLIHRQLADFMMEVTLKVSDNAALWNLYAEYWKALGNMEQAISFRNKQCRSLQKPDWETTPQLFEALVEAAQKLAADAIEFNNEKHLYSTKLYLNSINKKAMDTFDGSQPQIALVSVLRQVTEKENFARENRK